MFIEFKKKYLIYFKNIKIYILSFVMFITMLGCCTSIGILENIRFNVDSYKTYYNKEKYYISSEYTLVGVNEQENVLDYFEEDGICYYIPTMVWLEEETYKGFFTKNNFLENGIYYYQNNYFYPTKKIKQKGDFKNCYYIAKNKNSNLNINENPITIDDIEYNFNGYIELC